MKAGKFLKFTGAGLWAVMLLATACADDVGTIDRTDPNRIRKADLKGIYFMQMTVVEAPVPSPVTFNGEQNFGGGASVIFDIQEDWLIAYPISELYVAGSEKEWKKTKIRNYWEPGKSDEFMEIYVGQPVAAYKIQSHFDVQRDYNPQTGDQGNIISENTSDRPWYEREYIRVDWSNNEIKDLMFLAGVNASPVDYYVQEYEIDNPDRFHMGEGGFHFVTKMFLDPVSYESCSIYDVAPYDCAGAVIKIRTSFRLKDPNSDYIPIFYDNATYEDRFGFFLTSRQGFDVKHGIIYSQKQWFANRWNIWKNSRTNEPIEVDGAQVACRLDSDCEGLVDGQVHCWLEDGWFSAGHCVTWDPIPYHKREPKPIVYHLSASWPDQLWDTAYRTANVWSDAFKETVAWLQLYSEKGIYDVRYCSKNTDCYGAEPPVFDSEMMDTHDRFCSSDTECKAGIPAALQAYQVCNAQGVCVGQVPCDASKPCPMGQACFDNICKTCPGGNCDLNDKAGWVAYESRVQDRGAFTLAYYQTPKGAQFKMFTDDPIPFLEANQVQVLVYNINTSEGDVVLKVGDQSLCKTADNKDVFFPMNLGSESLGRPAGCLIETEGDTVDVKVIALSSGKELGTIPFVKLVGGEIHSFVVGGDDKVSTVAHSATPYEEYQTKGIRLANMAIGKPSVDFAVQASRRWADVKAGTLTPYTSLTQQENRIVIVPAGANGELTCFHETGGVGMCMGWRSEFNDDDMARYQEIYDSLPELFVACENQYTGDKCTPEQIQASKQDKRAMMNDCRNWTQDRSGNWYNPCAEFPEATSVKLHGDTRYNQFYWVSESQSASPLGYGPSSADPDTGEVFYGIANIYGADMVSYGQYAFDLLAASRGEITKENIISADYVKEFIENREASGISESLYAPLDVDRKELERRRDAKTSVKRFWLNEDERKRIQETFSDPAMVRAMIEPAKLYELVNSSLPAGMSQDQAEARFDRVRGTWLEGLLLNKEVQNAFRTEGEPYNSPLSGEQMTSASPLSWAAPSAKNAWDERAKKLNNPCYYSQELVEPYIFGTAQRIWDWCSVESNWTSPNLKVPYTSEEDCRMWQITREMLYGTLEHEVGHTVGLRHNFTASTDLFNYEDPYYEKREKDYRRCWLEGGDGCAFGDYCRIRCDSDEDCVLPGTTCMDVVVDGASIKACVDEHISPVGVCWGRRTERLDCFKDGDCASAGEGSFCFRDPEQKSGYCKIPAKADNQGMCPTGLRLVGDKCLRSDTCDTGAKKCKIDGSRTCATDGDCEVEYTWFEIADAEDKPLKMFVPRGHLYQSEVENSRNEYQYSSLMDYGGTINFDVRDLGKYDKAAIRFGYGELVDVYTDTDNLQPAMERVGNYYGFDPIYLSFLMDSESFTSLIFSPWLMLNDFIGVKQNLERVPAPFRKVRAERRMLESEDRGVWDMSYRVVPYKFRGDEWNGNWETYTFDVGADGSEIVEHSWSKLHEYYVFDAFKRERWGAYRGANPLGYFNRISDRWFPPMADAGRFFAIYYNVFRPWPDYREQVVGDVMRLGYMREMADNSLVKLTQLLFSPAPGSYVKVDEGLPTERFVNYDYSMGAAGSQLDIPIGEGKFPYTTYWRDAGYYYFQHAAFVGSFWEKIAALNAMTYSLGYFVGSYLGEQVPVGVATSIGFNTNYYTELVNMLGGFLVGKTDEYRPYIGDDGKVHFVDPRYPHEAAGKPRVEASIEGISMKAYIGLYAWSFLPTGFDPGWQAAMFLCLEGSGNCYTPFLDDPYGETGAAIEEARFTDPWSLKTYLAYNSNFDERRLSPSFWLVERANALYVQWDALDDSDPEKAAVEVELRDVVETLDMILTFNELYGYMAY